MRRGCCLGVPQMPVGRRSSAMWAQSPVGPSDSVTQSCFLSQNPKSPKVSLFQPQEACPNINCLIPILSLPFSSSLQENALPSPSCLGDRQSTIGACKGDRLPVSSCESNGQICPPSEETLAVAFSRPVKNRGDTHMPTQHAESGLQLM